MLENATSDHNPTLKKAAYSWALTLHMKQLAGQPAELNTKHAS